MAYKKTGRKPGRKPYIQELEHKKTAQLAHKTINALLMRDDLTIDQQLKLALPMYLKTIPDKIEVNETKKLSYDERMQLADKLKELIDANNTSVNKQVKKDLNSPLGKTLNKAVNRTDNPESNSYIDAEIIDSKRIDKDNGENS